MAGTPASMETDSRDEDEPGAEGGGSADTPPPAPAESDDTPLGDTDQHSEADA